MNQRPPYDVVCYMARRHGLAGLSALFESERYRVARTVTHRRLPRSEDPNRGERPDFAEYRELSERHDVPLSVVDGSRAQEELIRVLDGERFDLIASISWRRLLSTEQLAQPVIGGVNVHRGDLPRYAGVFPVRRSLEDGQDPIWVCAHVLVDEVDSGEILTRACHRAHVRESESLDEATERVKRELTPLFGPLLLNALDKLVARHEGNRDRE